MKVTMLLTDAAQAVGGKLYILGGGWSICGPDPTPMGIAIKIEVPWDQSNVKHKILLEILDADGQPVGFEGMTPQGEGLRIEGEFEAGRPAGLLPGTPLDVVLGVNIGPLPLLEGKRYVWQLSINGESREDWRVGFSTRRRFAPAGPQPR